MGSGLTGLAVTTALVTAGCDTDRPLDLPGLPPLGAEPDQDRVLDALRDEQVVLDEVRQVRRRHPGLRRELATTAAVHEAHVALLSKAVDGTSPSDPADPGGDEDDETRVAPSPARARAQLARSEQGLADQHVATALKSRSGVLARLVASMSAAAAQQAVLLGAATTGAEADG